MSLSSRKDKVQSNKEKALELQKKRSAVPPDNYGDQYVDPMAQNLRTQGKGTRVRLAGWHSDKEVTERLKKIYGKDEEKTNKEDIKNNDA